MEKFRKFLKDRAPREQTTSSKPIEKNTTTGPHDETQRYGENPTLASISNHK